MLNYLIIIVALSSGAAKWDLHPWVCYTPFFSSLFLLLLTAPIAFLLVLWLLFGIDATYVKSNVFPKGCGFNTGMSAHLYSKFYGGLMHTLSTLGTTLS
jgi:hypothetical protein